MKFRRRTYIIIIVAIIAGLLFFVFKMRDVEKSDPIDEILDAMPIAPEGTSRNEKIKLAFDIFEKYSKRYEGEFEKLCKGGFINVEEKRLKEVADEIITNRVINYHPLEFAVTEDEAGITCLSDNEKWVLFSALNSEDESEKNYFCVDSQKRKGNFSLDRNRLKCAN